MMEIRPLCNKLLRFVWLETDRAESLACVKQTSSKKLSQMSHSALRGGRTEAFENSRNLPIAAGLRSTFSKYMSTTHKMLA